MLRATKFGFEKKDYLESPDCAAQGAFHLKKKSREGLLLTAYFSC